MHGRLPGRALACLLLLAFALGFVAPGVPGVGRTTGAAPTGAATAAVVPDVGGGAAALDPVDSLVVVASPGRAGTPGAAPVHGLAPTTALQLAPLLLAQLPRPPSAAYASRTLSGSQSRAPPAVAGT